MTRRSSPLLSAGMMLALCAVLILLTACPGPERILNTTDPQWVHRKDPNAKVVLVFVHGIFGDTLGTWTNPNGTRFFDLVDKDPDLGPKVDSYAFGYTSRMFGSGSFDIQEAANRLHIYLDHAGVLGYPAIVFVAHSMGGLVVLRELLTHREMLDRVKLILLYATPQEGAQITTIARKVAHNPALEQMLPADRDGYLRLLNDEWKGLEAAKRPPIRCAYEKRPTYGVMVVPWSSATRYCDETALAVDANHLTIANPDRPGHDSMVFLSTMLKQYVLGKQLVAKLETPDFQMEKDYALLTISDPFGRRDARLVNAGGTKLTYTLEQFPDRELYVIPGPGPDDLAPTSTRTLQFVVGYGAKDAEYRFLLTSDAPTNQKVVVRIQNLPAVQMARSETAQEAARKLDQAFSDKQELERLKRAGADDPAASKRILDTVRDTIGKRSPQLTPSGQWLLSAELLNSVNWPGLAVRALQNAQKAEPAVVHVPAVHRLASVSATLAGKSQVFAGVPVRPLDVRTARAEVGTNPWTDARACGATCMGATASLADQLQQIPSLAAHGSSLQGDLKSAEGDARGAIKAYKDAAYIRESPSISHRLHEAKQAAAAKPWPKASGAARPPSPPPRGRPGR
jgi:pimeloyl-ACP methyl ester carboxylesterase